MPSADRPALRLLHDRLEFMNGDYAYVYVSASGTWKRIGKTYGPSSHKPS